MVQSLIPWKRKAESLSPSRAVLVRRREAVRLRRRKTSLFGERGWRYIGGGHTGANGSGNQPKEPGHESSGGCTLHEFA